MTVLGCDDMGDTYAAADATMMGWDAAPSSIQTGYVGGSCHRLGSNVQRIRAMINGAEGTIGMHLRFSSSSPALSNMIHTLESATQHFRVAYNGDDTFTITRNGTALTGGVSSVCGITANTWFTFEFWFKISDTVGDFELRINGVAVATGNGTSDTKNGLTGIMTNFLIGTPVAGGYTLDVDDLWWASGIDFQGDVRAIGNVANAAGNYAQWAPLASTNVSQVDDATPDGDTSYNSSATVGHIDSFAFAALGVASGATVVGVLSRNIVRKDDAAGRTIQNLMRIAATDYVSATSPGLSTSYAAYEDFRLLNPNTAAAWTVAGVDGTEFGYKEIT